MKSDGRSIPKAKTGAVLNGLIVLRIPERAQQIVALVAATIGMDESKTVQGAPDEVRTGTDTFLRQIRLQYLHTLLKVAPMDHAE